MPAFDTGSPTPSAGTWPSTCSRLAPPGASARAAGAARAALAPTMSKPASLSDDELRGRLRRRALAQDAGGALAALRGGPFAEAAQPRASTGSPRRAARCRRRWRRRGGRRATAPGARSSRRISITSRRTRRGCGRATQAGAGHRGGVPRPARLHRWQGMPCSRRTRRGSTLCWRRRTPRQRRLAGRAGGGAGHRLARRRRGCAPGRGHARALAQGGPRDRRATRCTPAGSPRSPPAP